MKRLVYLLGLTLVAFLLVACSPEIRLLDDTKLKDLSLLSGEPCGAPCWNGIVPGETSFRDAKLIIEEDQRFHNVEEAERQEGSDARIFGFSPQEAQLCCQVFSRNGETVTSLLIQVAPDMSLGPVLDRYGTPVYVGGEAPSQDQAYMALVFADVPMVVYAFVAGSSDGQLSGSSEIIGTMYMSAVEMDLLLSCSRLYDWEGFQSFSSTIDDNHDYVGADVDNEDVCGSN